MSFETNLRKIRKEKKLTQTQLAQEVGISTQLISQYELGFRKPSIVIGVRIAQILGTTCEDLVKQ